MSHKGKCRLIVSNCSMNDYVLVHMRAEHKPQYLVAFGKRPCYWIACQIVSIPAF